MAVETPAPVEQPKAVAKPVAIEKAQDAGPPKVRTDTERAKDAGKQAQQTSDKPAAKPAGRLLPWEPHDDEPSAKD